MWRVAKVLNNNVVLASSGTEGGEAILVGKGLGFGQHPGDEVQQSDPRVERVYVLADPALRTQMHILVRDADPAVIGLAQEAIARAERSLGPLANHIHVALADHIQFAVKRLQEGLEVPNPFLDETRALYPKEFSLAEECVAYLSQELSMSIPDGEKGFLALHFHAARSARGLSEAAQDTFLIGEVVERVESGLGTVLSEGGIDYARFLTHLRFAIMRLRKGLPLRNPLLPAIRREFRSSYALAEEIAAMISEELDKKVPKAEVGYLAMHIERLKMALGHDESPAED